MGEGRFGRSNINLSGEFYIVKISPQPLFIKEGRKYEKINRTLVWKKKEK